MPHTPLEASELLEQVRAFRASIIANDRRLDARLDRIENGVCTENAVRFERIEASLTDIRDSIVSLRATQMELASFLSELTPTSAAESQATPATTL